MATSPEHLECIVCRKSAAPSSIIGNAVRGGDEGRFRVVRCAHCGHAQLHPLPSESEAAANYADHVHPKTLWVDANYFDTVRKRVAFDIERRMNWIATLLPAQVGGRVLDIESGYGFLVDELCRAGYEGFGMETHPERLALAREQARGTYYQSGLDADFVDANRGRFDIVCNCHVLEHLRNPVEAVSRMLALVAPGGRLLIEIPNLADELIDQIPEYAFLQLQMCHFSYFDAAHLESVIAKAGATKYEIAGVQRFGLRHLVQWADERGPQIRGYAEDTQFPLFEQVEAAYKRDRIERRTCDTLIATIQKP